MNSLKLFFILSCLGLVLAVPLNSKGGPKRLIKISEKEPPKWLDEVEILELIKNDQGFIDLTNSKNSPEAPVSVPPHKNIPPTLKYQAVVKEAIKNIDLGRIENFIRNFTDNFNNRYQDADSGVASQNWLQQQIISSIHGSSYSGDLSVRTVNHVDWKQNSIIVTINGSDPILKKELVILGAHQDSINHQGGDYITTRAPGADDNASGCITLLEALRAILANQIIPNRTVEFHWYAAEERGLLGSKEIAETYYKNNVTVAGMINFDVVGYYVEGADDIAIITDYVDLELTNFLRKLVTEYLDYGIRERVCGYMCSDHASWDFYKYPVTRPAQAVRNPLMHTLQDTIEIVSFVQIREFVKIAIGFLVELAEPSSSNVSII